MKYIYTHEGLNSVNKGRSGHDRNFFEKQVTLIEPNKIYTLNYKKEI